MSIFLTYLEMFRKINSETLLIRMTDINTLLRGVIYTRTIAHWPRCQRQLLHIIFSPAHIHLHHTHTWRCSEKNSVTLLICITDINSFLRGVIHTRTIAHWLGAKRQLLHIIFSPAKINSNIYWVCSYEYNSCSLSYHPDHSSYLFII